MLFPCFPHIFWKQPFMASISVLTKWSCTGWHFFACSFWLQAVFHLKPISTPNLCRYFFGGLQGIVLKTKVEQFELPGGVLPLTHPFSISVSNDAQSHDAMAVQKPSNLVQQIFGPRGQLLLSRPLISPTCIYLWNCWCKRHFLQSFFFKNNPLVDGRRLHNYRKPPCYYWENPRTFDWAIFNSEL